MASIIACMFVADVVLVFVGGLSAVVLSLYRLMLQQYKKSNITETADSSKTMNSKLYVKNKTTGEIFIAYDNRCENNKVEFMIYKDNEFRWMPASEYEPA